jgi:hypothetical protein
MDLVVNFNYKITSYWHFDPNPSFDTFPFKIMGQSYVAHCEEDDNF